jgi:hypothetical protein
MPVREKDKNKITTSTGRRRRIGRRKNDCR